jgi:hypothetical protein
MIGVDEDYFTRAIKLRPDLAKAWGLRGRARIAADKHKAAIADLDWAIKIEAESGRFHLYRAQARLGLGLISESLADYAAAGKLAESYDVAVQAAKVLEKHEQFEDAEAAFARAIALCELERKAHEGDARRALAPLLEAYLARHRVRVASGDHSGAVADLRRCLALDDNCVTAKVELSRLTAARPGGPGGHVEVPKSKPAPGRVADTSDASDEILGKVRIVFEVLALRRGFDDLNRVVHWPTVYANERGAKRRFKTVSDYVRSRKRFLESTKRPVISTEHVERIMKLARVDTVSATRAHVTLGRRKLCSVEKLDGQWKVTQFYKLR